MWVFAEAIPYLYVIALVFVASRSSVPFTHFLGFGVCGWAVLTTSDASVEPIVSMSGIAVYPGDVGVGILAVLALMGIQRISRDTLILAFLAIVVVMLVQSVIFGTSAYGVQQALNEARPFAYVIVALIWALTIDWNDRCLRAFFVAWCAILVGFTAALCILQIARTGIATSSEFYIDGLGNYRTLRPLVSSQAMSLGLGTVVCLYAAMKSRAAWLYCVTFVGLIGVLLAQHRSVWVSVAFGCFILVVGAAGLRMRLVLPALVGATTLLAVWLSGAADAAVEATVSSIDAVFGPRSSFADREAGWAGLISEIVESGDQRVLLGMPMGHGYERIGANGLVATYSPHNWYVQMMLRAGLLGMAAFISILVLSLVRAIRSRQALALSLLAALAAFQWAYAMQWYFVIFLGYGIVAAQRSIDAGNLAPARDVDPVVTR